MPVPKRKRRHALECSPWRLPFGLDHVPRDPSQGKAVNLLSLHLQLTLQDSKYAQQSITFAIGPAATPAPAPAPAAPAATPTPTSPLSDLDDALRDAEIAFLPK